MLRYKLDLLLIAARIEGHFYPMFPVTSTKDVTQIEWTN